jgi:flagellar basal body rod protein FlgF
MTEEQVRAFLQGLATSPGHLHLSHGAITSEDRGLGLFANQQGRLNVQTADGEVHQIG